MQWYFEAFKRFAEFEGRSTRTEYWSFQGINLGICLSLQILAMALPDEVSGVAKVPLLLYVLIALLPALSCGARRLHDTGQSGWWLLLSFLPIVGSLVLIVMLTTKSETGPNLYGPDLRLSPIGSETKARLNPASEAMKPIPPPTSSVKTEDPSSSTGETLAPIAAQSQPLPPAEKDTSNLVLASFIGGVVVVGIIVVVLAQNSSPNMTAKTSVDLDSILKQPTSSTNPCPSGLPAGVKIVPIQDVSRVEGSDGRAIYDPHHHSVDYTPQELADHGYTDTSYWVGRWNFSLKVINNTGVPDSQGNVNGYCLASFEYEVEVQSDDGRTWTAVRRHTFDAALLAPGWSQELPSEELTLPRQVKDGHLASWQIVRAWGFPLHPSPLR
jgi:uncharacterized membrane protein YhaH (DUF805 family)